MLLEVVLGWELGRLCTVNAKLQDPLDPYKEGKERGKGAENRAAFPGESHEAQQSLLRTLTQQKLRAWLSLQG